MGRRPAVVARHRARRGEGDRLREEILAAARRLLVERGDAEAVSIRAVADAVGITPPSIYLHFADKNELMFAACHDQFEALDAFVEADVAGARHPGERLRRRAHAYVRFGLDHPEEYRILFMGRPWVTPAHFTTELVQDMCGFQHLLENVEECIDAGVFGARDPFVVACQLWMAVHGITSLMLSKPDFPWPPLDALVDDVVGVYSRGLAP